MSISSSLVKFDLAVFLLKLISLFVGLILLILVLVVMELFDSVTCTTNSFGGFFDLGRVTHYPVNDIAILVCQVQWHDGARDDDAGNTIILTRLQIYLHLAENHVVSHLDKLLFVEAFLRKNKRVCFVHFCYCIRLPFAQEFFLLIFASGILKL